PSGLQAKTTSAVWTLWLPSEDGSPRFGARTGVGLLLLGLVLGALAGWYGRAEDLLSERAAQPKALPGLWIEPGWRSVPRLNSPEEQYRDAQVRAPQDGREAAWLAVPGHFPNSREWAVRAYTQLTRLLLRRGDAERLKVLAEEIDRWDLAQTHEKELADVARV